MVAWYRMDLEIHYLDDGQAIGFYGPVLIRVVTTAPSDGAILDKIKELTEAALVRWPMAGMWVVVHHGAPFPDSEFRRRFGPVLRPYRERQTFVVTLLGLGFWASSAVAMSSGLSKLLGQHSTVGTSLERSAEHLGQEMIGVDAEKLIASYHELLAAIQSHAKVA